jgi:hypothetical protein
MKKNTVYIYNIIWYKKPSGIHHFSNIENEKFSKKNIENETKPEDTHIKKKWELETTVVLHHTAAPQIRALFVRGAHRNSRISQPPPPCSQTMQAVAFASAPAIFASASASVRPCRSAAPDIVSSDSGRPRRGARGAVRCEVASSSAPSAAGPQAARWAQRTVVIPPQRRGCHLITNKVPFLPRHAPPRPLVVPSRRT